jgi:hypothetical protein
MAAPADRSSNYIAITASINSFRAGLKRQSQLYQPTSTTPPQHSVHHPTQHRRTSHDDQTHKESRLHPVLYRGRIGSDLSLSWNRFGSTLSGSGVDTTPKKNDWIRPDRFRIQNSGVDTDPIESIGSFSFLFF